MRELPDNVLRLIQDTDKRQTSSEPQPDSQQFQLDANEIKRARAALGYLDADAYENWVQVGMALYELAGGTDQLFELWNYWSASSAKYQRKGMKAKWRSFASDRADKITENSFWYLAHAAGFQDVPTATIFSPVADVIRTVTHAELVKQNFSPIKWGIKNLVPQGVTMLAAKPKIGKSWFALQMCWAKAAGRETWDGREPEDQGEALYISLEDSLRRLKNRSEISFPQRNQSNFGEPFHFVADPQPDLHFATEWPRVGEGGLGALRTWLAEHPRCDLVVIDTWARIREKIKGNATYQDDYKLGEGLKPIADEYNVAIVIIHHTRKQEAEDPLDLVSGTQGVAGSVDTVMVLSRIRGSGDAQLFVTGRDIQESPDVALRFDQESCTWRSTGISVTEAKLDKSRQQIIAVIRRANDPLTIRDIRRGLTEDGITKTGDAISKAVGRMVTDNQIEKVETNKYDLVQAESSWP